MSDHFAEFGMPDTDLTRQTYALVAGVESATLAHHSVRSYLFGRAVGEARGVTPGKDYDDELLFLACLLHDTGLTELGDGEQRFEVDGADLADESCASAGSPRTGGRSSGRRSPCTPRWGSPNECVRRSR